MHMNEKKVDVANDLERYIDAAFKIYEITLDRFKRRYLDFSPTSVDTVSDIAFRFFISDRIAEQKKNGNGEADAVTEKQRAAIKSLGGDINKVKTKQEASEYIKKLLARR